MRPSLRLGLPDSFADRQHFNTRRVMPQFTRHQQGCGRARERIKNMAWRLQIKCLKQLVHQLRGKGFFEPEPPVHFRVFIGLKTYKPSIEALRWLQYSSVLEF